MDFESAYLSLKEKLLSEIANNRNFIDVCAEYQIPNTKYSLRVWGEENAADDKFYSIAIYDHSKDDPTMQLFDIFSESESMPDLYDGIKAALTYLDEKFLHPTHNQPPHPITLPPFPSYGNLDQRNLLDLIRAYDKYIFTLSDSGLLSAGVSPANMEEFFKNEYRNIWCMGGSFDYLYGLSSEFTIPPDRVENARAFFLDGILMCQIDDDEQFRPLKSKIEDIREGDAFIIECEHPSVYIAKEDAHQNLDERDEPWIVYDQYGNGWFEEDIADAQLMFRSLEHYTSAKKINSFNQMLEQAQAASVRRHNHDRVGSEPERDI